MMLCITLETLTQQKREHNQNKNSEALQSEATYMDRLHTLATCSATTNEAKRRDPASAVFRGCGFGVLGCVVGFLD